jgi:hypothetical protein
MAASDARIADQIRRSKMLAGRQHKRRLKQAEFGMSADGSMSRLHHVRGRGHGSLWPTAAQNDIRPNVCYWGDKRTRYTHSELSIMTHMRHRQGRNSRTGFSRKCCSPQFTLA